MCYLRKFCIGIAKPFKSKYKELRDFARQAEYSQKVQAGASPEDIVFDTRIRFAKQAFVRCFNGAYDYIQNNKQFALNAWKVLDLDFFSGIKQYTQLFFFFLVHFFFFFSYHKKPDGTLSQLIPRPKSNANVIYITVS